MTEETQYDVFLSHSSADKESVEVIARRVRDEAGLQPWFDKWHLVPGTPWQEALEEALSQSQTCAVFIGPGGFGAWHQEEMRVALDARVRDPGFRVIPVLLPGADLPERGGLPPFLTRHTWVDFRPGLDDPHAFHNLICGIKGVAPVEGEVPAEEAVCPYLGLRPFQEEHARFFFGRDAMTQWLVEDVRQGNFLAIIGPSGCGKSSLARAGLLPALRRGALPGSDRWPIRILTPGAEPVTALSSQLLPLLNPPDPIAARRSLTEGLRADPRELSRAVGQILAGHPLTSSEQARLLLLVDQFEELFTLCYDEAERAAFIAALLDATSPDQQGLVGVLTMRADFYSGAATYHDLAARLERRQRVVSPLDEASLRQAVEEPARLVRLRFEKGLVDTILDDAGHEPGVLPLVQHTLWELWQRRRGQWLTFDAYRAIGGVQGALAHRAEEIYASFTPEEREVTRRVLLRLTRPGEGTEDTRRRASKAELIPDPVQAEMVERVVQKLANARLLITAHDEDTGQEVADVSHEALIRGWPRLRGWIDEDRAGLRTHRRLTETVSEWEENNRDESYLYRGARLAQAEEWAEAHTDDMNPLEREFVEASVEMEERAAREEEARRQQELEQAQALAEEQHQRAETERQRAEEQARAARRLGRLAVVLAVVFMLAVGAAMCAGGAAWYAREQQRIAATRAEEAVAAQGTAEWERDRAEHWTRLALSRQLATQSANQLDAPSYGLALLLAIEAGRTADTAEAFAALRQALAHSGHTILTFAGHTGDVYSAIWNADETRILTASDDGTARVWDAETGAELVTLSGHMDSVYWATWIADESRILTRGCDRRDESDVCLQGTVRVWDAETGAELVTLPSHFGTATWRKDGSRILIKGCDRRDESGVCLQGTARVWDGETGAELLTLSGHEGSVLQAQWNADESRILTSGTDGTARVWDAKTGAELLTLSGHEGSVLQAQWNADESRILTTGTGGTAHVWDAETGAELLTLSGHTKWVNQAKWNADESRILTVSQDGTARVWDAETGAELLTLSGHTDRVRASWNTNETRILTSSEDGTARVWDAETGAELLTLSGHTDSVRASWNTDETRILTSSEDGTARVWDAETGAALVVLRGHTDAINMALWNVDGSRILTASDDGTVRVWDTAGGVELTTLSGRTSEASQTVWNADGSRILTVSQDRTARVWDAETGVELVTLSGHTAQVNQAIWNADESRILTTSRDGTARVWDAETGAERLALSGHTEWVLQAVWNADGSRILTAGCERVNDYGECLESTARVWDVETGAELVTLSDDIGVINQVAWNVDGSRILTTGLEEVTGGSLIKSWVWDAETGAKLLSLSGLFAWWNPDGSRILSASFYGPVWLEDAETGATLVTLSGHTDQVNQAIWNAYQISILTISDDDTVRVWDADTGLELVTISGHTGDINQATWNADESLILTASDDGLTRVWDAETGAEVFSVIGSRAWWNADGSRILTLSEEGIVRQYYTRMEDLLEVACQRVSRNMTREEWERYLPGQDYRKTCEQWPLEEE